MNTVGFTLAGKLGLPRTGRPRAGLRQRWPVVGAATDRSWVAFCLSADSLQVKILALTVVTSMSDQDLEKVGVASTVREQVARLARLAIAAGCHGVVSSPLEARQLREVLPPGALIVTPGTQLSGDAQSDHARAATTAQAIAAGATHVVIGRPISRALNPAAVFAAVHAELAAAIQRR